MALQRENTLSMGAPPKISLMAAPYLKCKSLIDTSQLSDFKKYIQSTMTDLRKWLIPHSEGKNKGTVGLLYVKVFAIVTLTIWDNIAK